MDDVRQILAGQATSASIINNERIAAGLEFAAGLNLARYDPDTIRPKIVGNELKFTYPTRLPTSNNYTLLPKLTPQPHSRDRNPPA